MSEEIEFWVLLGPSIVLASIDPKKSLVHLLRKLQRDSHTARYVPPNVAPDDCTFSRLKNAVSTLEDRLADDFREKVRQACLEEKNMVHVDPVATLVGELVPEPVSPNHVYLVVEFPDTIRASAEAIDNLRQEHGALFQCLLIQVQNLGKWCREDVAVNMRGGALFGHDSQLDDQLKTIKRALEQKRTYNEPAGATANRDYDNARMYDDAMFNRVFRTTNGPPTVVNNREFASFYNLLRCFNKDVYKVAADESSSFKASNFTVHLIQPPFFSEIHRNFDSSFRYQPEKSWGFPIFVEGSFPPNTFRKFIPRSDWMVMSPNFLIPFVVSEVISDKGESDRHRMLSEAIAAARTGQFLMKSQSTKAFFVVAVYLNKYMVASRYILIPRITDPVHLPVDILEKNFDLQQVEGQVDFLREMYNLSTQIILLSNELDWTKKTSLLAIKNAAKKVLSLNTKTQGQRTTQRSGNAMETIPEGTAGEGGNEGEHDPRIFKAKDIQTVLQQMNYKIRHCVHGHPHLAIIENKSSHTAGYLKFVAREDELKILQYLSEIDSPLNHTIHSVQFWPVEGGTVVSMPVAGGWLTSLENPNEHLWSVTLQLVEAVAFMHEHNVAHMDIKPENVIIPEAGGRLSIIDFSVSIRVRSADATSSRVVGTKDYIAPEVKKGRYKPMLADLWSCGRTLKELCGMCLPSEACSRVLEIAKLLMKDDPEGRPQMSTVLEWMSSAQLGDDGTPSTTSPPLITAIPVSPLRA